jgi:hypothetical protein
MVYTNTLLTLLLARESPAGRRGPMLDLLGSFRRNRVAMTLAAGIATASALGTFSAAAEEAGKPFTQTQCSNAISIANALVQANRGQISNGLVDSFVRFSKSKCDLNIDWNLTGKNDEKVFGEFRVRLIALRSADVGKPAVLAKH